MPHLHIHLRDGIDLEDIYPGPDEIIQDASDEHHDPELRAAKRRRIETIATQYLRGRNPIIMTASLKGPFGKGWKNPWTSVSQKETTAPVRTARLSRKDTSRHTKVTRAKKTRVKSPTNEQAVQCRMQSPSPSPETLQVIESIPEDIGPAKLHENGDEGSITAPTGQHDQSNTTEFHSANSSLPTTVTEPEGRPQWLRRQTFVTPRNRNDSSPTRSKSGRRPLDEHGGLQLAPPNLPLSHAHSDPIQATSLEAGWRSSFSASMVISSPVKHPYAMPNIPNKSPTNRKRSLAAIPCKKNSSKHTSSSPRPAGTSSNPLNSSTQAITVQTDAIDYASEAHHHTQPLSTRKGAMGPGIDDNLMQVHLSTSNIDHTEQSRTFTPINSRKREVIIARSLSDLTRPEDAGSKIEETRLLATEPVPTNSDRASSPIQSTRRPSREEIHQFAEHCAAIASTSKSNIHRSKRKLANGARHDWVTSLTPDSSTGLVYRKAGKSKSETVGPEKPKPRVMAFSSSPPIERGPRVIVNVDTDPQQLRPVEDTRSARRDIYDLSMEPDEAVQQESFRSTRTSGYSTQAAMMLAQLEFQDGTMSAIAPETLGPELPTQSDTLQQQKLGEDNPAFTPFHAFNKELNEIHPPDSIPSDMQISTQDLFTAASPFAFSTNKKKSTKSQRSSLRFAVFPSGNGPGYADQENGAKSPTPTERIPLKERNSKVSFRSTLSEKGGSQDSTGQEPKPTVQDVEVPQLELSFGPTGSFDFADRFLRTLNNDLT